MTTTGDDTAPSPYDEPYLFDFFQAVRLLQASRGDRAEVGHDAAPTEEAIRFASRTGLGFPASAVHDLRPGDEARPPRMEVAFFGLTGPSGVLPSYFSETVLEEGDGGPFGAFLEIFDHRLISFFYRAWERNHPHLAGTPEASGRFAGHLLALAGLALDPEIAPRAQDSLPYAGLFANRRRSATGLQCLLLDLLNGDGSPLVQLDEPVAVDVVPFVGRWLTLDAAMRPILGRGPGDGLGPSTIIGRRVRDHRGKFRVRIGPLGLEQFRALLPESTRNALGWVVAAIREYVGPAFAFDLELRLRPEDALSARLGGADALRLGRTWLTRLPPDEPLAIILRGPPG
jgi:type VI secretion system protein ImpH